jgi:hypothetical protein
MDLDQRPAWRVKSLSGVWLREPITLEDVSYTPHPDLRVELSRLEALEQQTIGLWESPTNS